MCLAESVDQGEHHDEGNRHHDDDHVTGGRFRQKITQLLPEPLEPALGDRRLLTRLILRASVSQFAIQLDDFLAVFRLNAPARLDPILLEAGAV